VDWGEEGGEWGLKEDTKTTSKPKTRAKFGEKKNLKVKIFP
jgi:hypothetical protein